MTTRERATALAEAAQGFSMLGLHDAEMLLELVRWELGHEDILDDFQPRGPIHAQAIAPRGILHVVAGNTPAAALQSLIRGLLLGSENFCKTPSAGLAELDQFRAALPVGLAEKCHLARELPEEWLRQTEVVVGFGSDETIHQLRQRVSPQQIFLAHGHKVSAGVVFDAPEESLPKAARDICLFDQKGCLSLHTLYVDERRCGAAQEYGQWLGQAMAAFGQENPRAAITVAEQAEIQHLRASYAFRAANDARVALWQSPDSTDWTVICEDDPLFATSCLNRLVFVKPLPETLADSFLFVRPHLSTLAIWPFSVERVRRLRGLGFSRVCPLGQAQRPTWVWHQDGLPVLSSMVRWIDAG